MATTTHTVLRLVSGAKPLYFRCRRCSEPILPSMLGLSDCCLEHETEQAARLLRLERNRLHRNAKVREYYQRKNGK